MSRVEIRDLVGLVWRTIFGRSWRYAGIPLLLAASIGIAPDAAAVTVTASPSNCTETTIGGQSWSGEADATTSDNDHATASVNDNQHTNYLACTGFGFSIPGGATIHGVTVNVERRSSGSITRDYAVRLIKGGTIGSVGRSTGNNYGTTDSVEAHGDATDLWGTTWSPAEINAANFGTAFAAQKVGTSGGSRTVRVDHIQVVVNYTLPFSCTQPANTPAGLSLTCVCDTFERTALNPSPIFGSNWIVSASDTTGILPSIVNSGYLRLTNNTGNNAKAATVPGIFPAAGNYISVEFNHFAYNGSGADGIAITLSDYSVPAVPGAFGGSLGYAQKTGISGFAGGWLGVALDEFGNYQNPTEGRIGGPGFFAQSVGARGSGAGTAGYRWLGGTAALSPEIDNSGSTNPTPGYAYQVIVDARSEPTSTAIRVNRDTGFGYTSLINIPNVYSAATDQGFTQAPVPANWQISFAGSTGGSTNIHELSSLRICAQTVYPPSGGTASGFNAIDEAYGVPPLAVQNYLNGHIYMKLVGVPFKLNVAALTDNQIQTAYVVSGTKSVTVKLVDNSDNVCVLDSTKSNYCSATCRAKNAVSGGSQIVSFASSNAGQKQSADFTLNTAYSKLAAIVSDGTTTACSTDSFSVRPTAISSVTATSAILAKSANNVNTSDAPVFKAGAEAFEMTMATAGVAGVASGYTGVAKINNAAILPVSPATVSGTIAPATFPAGVSGNGASTATGATFTYSEVGAFTLAGYNPASDSTSPRGVYDGVQTVSECAGMNASQCDSLKLTTSWTGIDSVSTSGDCIADSYINTKVNGKYGCNFGLVSTTSGFGRFVPNEFVVVSPVLTNRHAAACVPVSTFSYLDEAMGLQFTLEARAGGGNVTRNYAGALAKLVLLADGSELDFGAAVPAPFQALASNRIVGAGFATAWPAMGTSSAGTVAFDGSVSVSSLTSATNNRVAPDGPFVDLVLGVAPVDSDGVRILAYDLDADNSGGATGPDHKALGTTTQYFGLLRLVPAIGTELLPLSMRAEILRWNGAGFVPNGDDGCTQIPMANLGLSKWTGKLSAGETGVTSGSLVFASGVGAIKLSAPGAGNNGSVLVTADVAAASLPYLGGHWSGASKYDLDPSAVASFGLYKGAGQIMHFRENY